MQKDFINTLCDALGLSTRLERVTIEHDFTDSHSLTRITTVQVPPKGEISLPTTRQFVLQEIKPGYEATAANTKAIQAGIAQVAIKQVRVGDRRQMAPRSVWGDQRRIWDPGSNMIAIWSYASHGSWECVGLEPVVPNAQSDGEPRPAHGTVNPTGS